MVDITLEHIVKTFPTPGGKGVTTAVDDVSLAIPAGHLFFLLGPSGCGKTTMLRMIAGFTLPTAGRILFGERDMSQVPPHLRDTGMVFQSYALWPHMTVAENVGFGLSVRKVKNPERAQRIAEALKLVQMETYHDRRPNQLSGGQQQRVSLARALAIRPQCLLLDEPLSNLDAKLRLEMRSEIRRIVKSAGITAIYVTHDQKEALSMADGIAVVNKGKLEQVGTPAELYRHPTTRFVADFIGESNFLSGTIENVNASTLTIKTAAGTLMAAPVSGQEYPKGKSVQVAIRPEAVSMSEANLGAAFNRLRGKRLATTYLGEMAEHLIALPGLEKPLKLFEINPRPNPPPVDVTVQIAAEHVIIVEG